MNTPIATTSGRQRGQILPIFAGGLVAILLIGALVVDLGFVFMTRRHEQNAADPGAVAAARYIRPTLDVPAMWTAACFYAVENGFRPTRTDTNAACDPGQPVDDSFLTVHYPPSRQAGEFAGDRAYVEVAISRSHESVIAGVVGLGQFIVSTSAVAANDDGSGGSSSLVSLSDQGCGSGAPAKINGGGSGGGLWIHPATGVDPDSGGYIQVNSDCGSQYDNDTCENDPKGALEVSGSNTTVIAPALYVHGACTYSGNNPPGIDEVQEGAPYIGDPLSLIRPPAPGAPADCPTGQDGTAANPRTCRINAAVTLSPGTYYGGFDIRNGARISLQAGIYIIAGGGISQTGGTVNLADASGRVLIYGTDVPGRRAACLAGTANGLACQQDVDLNGTGSINLRGLDGNAPCDPYGSASGCPYGGLLLWQDGTASGAHNGRADIFVGGGGSTFLEGTIYTPGGDVSLTGSSSSTGCTPDGSGNTNCASVQIIAWTWQIGGSAILDMPYDPDDFFQLTLKGLVK